MALERLGPYRIGRRLGRGGMGTVYEGVNSETGQLAAIKVLSASLNDEVGFRERFETEIETLKKLRHENIVRLFGWGEEDGQLYYAMELVAGATLEEELQAGRRFHWREVTRFGIMLCRALRHAHDRGVIHRDIKPANLLLTPEGVIKLSDFGIARLFGNTRLTADGGLIGTAEYMAPEQADGRPVTLHCDLYSLGSVLYTLLAGRPPFRSSSLPEMLQLQRFAEPPPLTRLAPDVPQEVADIIHGLLVKDPQGRPPNATVLGRQLSATEFGLAAREEATPTDVTQVAALPSAAPASDTAATGYDPLGATREVPAPNVQATGGNNPTVVLGASPAPDDDPELALAPLPATNRFTPIDHDQLGRDGSDDADASPINWQTLLLAAALVALVVGGWLAFRPPSAEAMYAKIQKAAEQNDPQRLLDVEEDIESYLARFPEDPNRAEIDAYRKEIEQLRAERRLRREATGRRGVTASLPPLERAYLDALKHAESDPVRALELMQAIVAVYDVPPRDADHATAGQSATRVSLDLVRQQIDKLKEQSEEFIERQKAVIERAFAQANTKQTSDPAAAKAILAGLITLYGTQPWAQPKLKQVRQTLADLHQAPPTKSTTD